MKVAVCYPPLESDKGTPLLSQNRQFQWFSNPLISYAIYPVVMASAATLLQEHGHQVAWLDGIAKKWSSEKFSQKLKQFNPDLVIMETKTPVVKKHWRIIRKLKTPRPRRVGLGPKSSKLKIVLIGDHVSARPEESLKNSPVDYVLTGGDYDFGLLNLVNYLAGKEELAGGVYYRENNQIKNTGKPDLKHNLNNLPLIDRDLTGWRDYAFKNSNFYRAPGVYTMFARDCWWGKCSFCSWVHNLYPPESFRTVTPQKALDEVEHLVKNYQVREIMDDSGTFPTGDWLRQFAHGMIERSLNKKVKINCNMRFNSDLTEEDYQLMGEAGFRFLLYGLESANQKTLNKINKNLNVARVEKVLQWATRAGMMPHVTVMIGWPWESKSDIQHTLDFVKQLFQKGLVFTMQATLVIPYPGTPLFQQAQENNWLKTTDWEKYDMRQAVLKTDLSDRQLKNYIQSLYSSFATPQFIWRTVKSMRGWDDVKYIGFQGLKFISKKLDFS